MIGETKVCTKCQLELPCPEGFYANKKAKGGLTTYCRECIKESRRKYVAKNRDEVNRKQREWASKNVDKRKKDQAEYRKKNRDRLNEAMRRRYWTDPERFRAAARDWETKNPEKRRAMKSAYRANNRQKVRSYWNARTSRKAQARGYVLGDSYGVGECMACNEHASLTIEHLIPLIRGGLHKDGNLTTLCRPCNSSKRELTFAEWKYSGRPRAREVFPGLWEKRQALKESRPHAA